jgi:FkbM family methyltransferase
MQGSFGPCGDHMSPSSWQASGARAQSVASVEMARNFAASAAAPQLVFDIGMHRGEDTEFYLSRGCNVVGIEANPALVSQLREKFATEIASGRVQIVDKAISDKPGRVAFTIDPVLSIWGSISPSFIERNRKVHGREDAGTASQVVEVESTTLDELVRTYGTPYYMKIDIEGMDMACIRALHNCRSKPRYVSIESAVTAAVTSVEIGLDELAHLWVLGYRSFKYVDQSELARLDGSTLEREGPTMRYKYRGNSSGPFGEESPGAWRPIGPTLRRMRALVLYQNSIGVGGRYDKTLASKIGRRLYRIVRRRTHSWYDLHARLG